MKTTFVSYLYTKKYSESTIRVYLTKNDRFIAWARSQGINPKKVNYRKLLQYIKYLHSKKYQPQSINGELMAIRQYFEYLISENRRGDNPAEGLHIKGSRKKVLHNLLNSEELEDLYYSYQTDHKNSLVHASLCREKVMLGFMVFQGITAEELYQLKEEHVQLQKGKIYIPSTKKSNSRELVFKAWQMMELQNYIQNIREQILNYSRTTQDEEQFFYGSKSQINGIITRISRRIKKYNTRARNHNHIRASVIVGWMKQYDDLRQVQYLAGHKHITSTEMYQQNDLEQLHKVINTLHPIS
ncbi:tyrosine-type recombinase/integrase [Aquimarina mytili]|uniref:Tyrosine-type recombinase/integrase n=1 Tax=Aquimarina mytili TaxID=874423 RepID=A0A936ZWS6_9FLAO|nr:tyrosine-type recombinase/integrase [Aquimarina mytili]MBL0685732.1 tyrosine-type recombinase/integrase [Aquimarina mytili]